MLRKIALCTLSLFAVDLAASALTPAVSLSQEAWAADFTGKIKRIRIKKTRAGSSFKVKAYDAGDGSSVDAATMELTVSYNGAVSDPVELTLSSYQATMTSPRFAYDGAVAPEGSFKLQTVLLNSEGKQVGAEQYWTLTAKDGELSVVGTTEISEGTYIEELELDSDDCGNGEAEAVVTGADADTVATVQFVALSEGLFDSSDVDKCTEGYCVEATLAKGKTTHEASDGDLGKVGDALAEVKDATVSVTVTAYDENGKLLGETKTEATAKYGDILIDGVPLQFD